MILAQPCLIEVVPGDGDVLIKTPLRVVRVTRSTGGSPTQFYSATQKHPRQKLGKAVGITHRPTSNSQVQQDHA